MMWHVTLPQEWPLPPETMSFTTLRQVESCPLQWALDHGSYPHIWSYDGYPPKLSAPMVEGRIVHTAIGKVLECLAQAGCESSADKCAVEALRARGGLALLVEECSKSEIELARRNPRLEYALRSLENQIGRAVGSLRQSVQLALSRIKLLPRPRGSRSGSKASGQRSRRSLATGSHCNVAIEASSLAWKGIADLIVVEGDGVEIVEVKSGKRHEDHKLQILLYSLLWAHDKELNPDGRPVRRLTLLYPNGAVNVAPLNRRELTSLERNTERRTEGVRRLLASLPPPPRLDPDQCCLCHVRHLCDEYWNSTGAVRSQQTTPGQNPSYVDVEVGITGAAGPTSWFSEVLRSRQIPPGTKLLLESGEWRAALSSATRVRVLDGQLRAHGNLADQGLAVVARSFSELYSVDRGAEVA